jgi:hypothetical protein
MSNAQRRLDLEMHSRDPVAHRLQRATVGPLEIIVAVVAAIVVCILLLNG